MVDFISFGNYNSAPTTNKIGFDYTLYYSGEPADPRSYTVKEASFTLSNIRTKSAALTVTLQMNGLTVSQTVDSRYTQGVTLSGEEITSFFAGVISHSYLNIHVSVATSGGATYGIASGCTAQVGLELEPNFSASRFDEVNSPVQVGQPAVFNIANANMNTINELRHVITLTIPNTSYLMAMDLPAGSITSDNQTAYFRIPQSWLSALSSQQTIPVNAVMETFAGNTSVGTYGPKEFSITVPGSYKPNITEVTTSMTVDTSTEAGRTVSSWGVWLQGYSIISFTVKAAPSPDGNAAIRSYKVTCGDETITAESSALTQKLTMSGAINSGGNIGYTVTVTDTRNRTVTTSGSFHVLPYAPPSVRMIQDPYRCNNTGIANIEGRWFAVAFEGQVSSCGGHNTMKLQVGKTKTITEAVQVLNDDVVAGELTLLDADLDPEIGYFVYCIVTDALGNRTATRYELMTAPYAIHVMNGGNGVAFGMVATNENCVEINRNWRFMIHDQDSDTRYLMRNETIVSDHARCDENGNNIAATYLPKNSLRFLQADTRTQPPVIPANGTANATIAGANIASGESVHLLGWNFYKANANVLYLEDPPTVTTTGGHVSFSVSLHNASGVQQPAYLCVYYVIM